MPGPFDYSAGYGSTCAPVTRLTISWNGRSRTVPAVIDSGASRTCIPVNTARILGLVRKGDVRTSGATVRERIPLPRYVVDLKFLGRDFNANPVLGIERPHALIGRDILNEYVATLDGPALQYTLTEP